MYTGIGSNRCVTKSLSIFRSKVQTFLRRFKQLISEDERKFWLEKLPITSKAVRTYQLNAKSSQGQGVKVEGVVNEPSVQNGVKHTAATSVVRDVNTTPNRFIWCGISMKGDTNAQEVPPPYGLVSFAIGMKSEAAIVQLKEAIANGEEAMRLGKLWNLDPDDSKVETMLSNLSTLLPEAGKSYTKITLFAH